MSLMDRYILGRFVTNFVLLFVLLFTFAISIDVIAALEDFVATSRSRLGADVGAVRMIGDVISLIADFQAPRFFQFYAYLHGIVAIGAMGFTLAQMHRHRELVAMLSAGISMQRIAMPFVVGAFGLSIVQLVNQEVFLPRVAPLLLRDHDHIGKRRLDTFPVAPTPDGQGSLVHSPSFDHRAETLAGVTILERDDRGRTTRRITAEEARWRDPDAAADGTGGWEFVDGEVVTLARSESDPDATATGGLLRGPIEFYASDLSPRMLLVRRYGQFAAMLSMRQLQQMLDTPGVSDREMLLRYRYARFATVFVNVLIMWLTLPTFLTRLPGNLLSCAIACAAIGIPAMIGSFVFMVMDLPGLAPAVGAFLPVIVLIPVVVAQWTYVKT